MDKFDIKDMYCQGKAQGVSCINGSCMKRGVSTGCEKSAVSLNFKVMLTRRFRTEDDHESKTRRTHTNWNLTNISLRGKQCYISGGKQCYMSGRESTQQITTLQLEEYILVRDVARRGNFLDEVVPLPQSMNTKTSSSVMWKKIWAES